MARRIANSSINWSSLAERIPPAQKTTFAAFKAKSDGYLRRVLTNPPEPPKIDWAFYKNSVPIAGMVDTFQKQYEALKIPYPQDTLTAQVEAQGAQALKDVEAFVKESNENIKKHEAEIARISALLPYNEMTVEDFYDANPEEAWDPKNPTFWPHETKEVVDDSKIVHSEHH